MKALKILSLPVLLVLLSCNSDQEMQVKEANNKSDNGIKLTAEQVRRAGIETGKIEKVLLSHDVTARGQITVPPQNRATVSAVMPGIIRSIRVNPGQQVIKGDVLAVIAHPEFIRIQQEFLDNLSQLEYLQKDYERQKQLRENNINSAKELQVVEASYRKARVAVESGKAKLKLLNIDIGDLKEGKIQEEVSLLSPITGTVNRIFANIGMSVEPGINLFDILNTTDLILQVKVFEKDMNLLKPGQRITFLTSGNNRNESVAHVKYISAMVDDETRTIEVLAEIDNPNPAFIPGMFVSSKIHTSEQMLEALPEEAVIVAKDNENYGFYTTDDPGADEFTFYRFNVKTGFAEDGYVHITPLDKIPGQAEIVIKGVYYIKSEMMKSLD